MPAAAAPPTIWLHADVVAQLPDNSLAFAKTGGTLLSAVIDGTIDVAVSGARFSVPVRVQRSKADGPPGAMAATQHVAIELDPARYATTSTTAGPEVLVDQRYELMVALNVGAVTSAGAACDAHAGFGLSPLGPALDAGFALIGLRYSQWDQLVGSIALTNLHLQQTATALPPRTPAPSSPLVAPGAPSRPVAPIGGGGGAPTHLAHRTVEDTAATASLEAAVPHFVEYVNGANELREKELVYPKSPHLSKSFTWAPKGFTTIDAIMHTSTGLSADQLEEVLAATATVGNYNDVAAAARMVQEAAVPGAAAAEFRTEAARAIHLAVRMATDYHVDGVARQEADGRVHFQAAESWLPFAQRTFLKESNDCDGSGLLCARLARQIGVSPYGDDRYDAQTGAFRSLDPAYDPAKHKWTTAVRNALAHTDVFLFTIVGATSGEGTKAISAGDAATGGLPPPPTAAGHAVAMLLEPSEVLRALSLGDSAAVDAPAAAELARIRFARLYPPGKVRALPEAERAHYASVEALRAHHQHLEVHPLSLDGTVTSEMRIHLQPAERKKASRLAKQESVAARRLGAVMASRLVDLTSTNPAGGHAFYLDFVEATLPHAFGDDPALRAVGQAAYQFVFVPVDERGNATRGQAGATPEAIDGGQYALVPLWRLNAESGAAIDRVREETVLHTLPDRDPARGADTINESERRAATSGLKYMADLDAALKKRSDAFGEDRPAGAYIELHVTPRMMWGNPNSVRKTAQKVLSSALHGQVHIHRLDSIAPDAALAVISFISK
jgi:hypothetical protein